ncbi:MAG: GHKL domain-containing protein [bacterium]|nr:GHKL domain-containing protein [bacterium]
MTILWIGAGALLVLALFLGGRAYLIRLVDRRISHYQSDLLEKHCEEVENMYRQTRGWRHDYHNHIQTMKGYLSMGETEKLGDYLDRLDEDLTTVDTVVKTGNVMIDAVLNSKLSLAKAKQIHVEAKAIVPPRLDVSDVDLSLIIGNLMDNAMEACLQIEEEERRFIRVYIDVMKGQLYLYVMNAVQGRPEKRHREDFRREISREKGSRQGGEPREERRPAEYRSSKAGISHGFGLMRIDRVVARYKGYIDRQDEENVFATEILLPLMHE